MSAQPHEAAAVEFGPADDEPGPRESRARLVTAILADPRLVVVLGGLAGVAAFASLVGEWYTADLSERAFGEATQVRTGVNGAGVLGATYLVGVLVLAALTMLVVAGPAAARRAAATAGLGVAGAVLAVLFAARTTTSFYQPSITLIPAENVTLTFGRGLTLAFLVPILTGAAFVLARRIRPAAPVGDNDEADDAPHPPAHDWAGWRRPRRPEAHPEAEPDPIELTVQPANPFARPDSTPER